MAQDLSGKTVAFLVANEGVEQVELTGPWDAVKKAGGRPVLAAPQAGEVQAYNHLDRADTFPVDVTTGQLEPGDYDAIVLPGGVANPDQLRTDTGAVQFVRAFFQTGNPAAAICHGPWTLIEADVVTGRTITSWPSLRTDLRNAGADWVDRDVAVDSNGPNILITSRKPDDLDAFCSTLLETL